MGAPENAGLTLFEVSKAFGALPALQDVSLRVEPGQVTALFGPNGAGKTTLLRVAAGLTKPSHGRVLIDGVDLSSSPSEAKRKIGWLADRPLLYNELTAQENLEFFGRLWGLPPAEAQTAAKDALTEAGMAHRSADPAGDLSRGMQQRLSLARALLHRPSVMLLDEPFEGLDPRGQQALLDKLREPVGRGRRATLLVTHQVDLGIEACDRAAVIDRGQLVKVLPRAELEPAAFAKELRALGGVTRAE